MVVELIKGNGFKETEVGYIPDEWGVAKNGDLAEVKYGKARPKEKGIIPAVGSGGIYAWVDKALVNFPTLVIGRKGTAGKVWLYEEPCWSSDTTFYLDWKQEVDVRFLHGYMTAHPLSGEHAKTTLPSLQRPDLQNYLVLLLRVCLVTGSRRRATIHANNGDALTRIRPGRKHAMGSPDYGNNARVEGSESCRKCKSQAGYLRCTFLNKRLNFISHKSIRRG